jgi:hypothetical protein
VPFAGCREHLEPAEEFGRFKRFGQKMHVHEFNAVILTHLRSGIGPEKPPRPNWRFAVRSAMTFRRKGRPGSEPI